MTNWTYETVVRMGDKLRSYTLTEVFMSTIELSSFYVGCKPHGLHMYV